MPARKLQVHTKQPEALKKALAKTNDERGRNVAKQTVDSLTVLNKKPLKIKKPHG